MATTQKFASLKSVSGSLTGDLVGGGVLALLGIVHLFVLQLDGLIGWLLLLACWPFVAGAVGAFVDSKRATVHTGDLPLAGAVAGVYGAIATVLLVLLTGVIGAWPEFIYDTFGVDLAPVTIAVTILLVITWTVAGYLGAYVVRTVLK